MLLPPPQPQTPLVQSCSFPIRLIGIYSCAAAAAVRKIIPSKYHSRLTCAAAALNLPNKTENYGLRTAKSLRRI